MVFVTAKNILLQGDRKIKNFDKFSWLINLGSMNERVAKIYLDTSVFGGYYDIDFEEETQILFKK